MHQQLEVTSMKFSKAVEGFLISKAADGYSQNTIEVYQWGLRILNGHLKPIDVSKITPVDLQRFMVWLQNGYEPKRSGGDTSPLTAASRENIWIAIRSFFNWAEIELELAKRPDGRLMRPKYQPRQIKPFTEDEIVALVKASQYTRRVHTTNRGTFAMKRSTANRDLCIILALLDTGLRVSELGRLKVQDINLESGEVDVHPYGTGKKSKGRRVYLGTKSRRLLWRHISQAESILEDYVFKSINNRAMNETAFASCSIV